MRLNLKTVNYAVTVFCRQRGLPRAPGAMLAPVRGLFAARSLVPTVAAAINQCAPRVAATIARSELLRLQA